MTPEPPTHERPIDFYLRLAGFMEAAAKKHPMGSPCWDRKMRIARGCRLKVEQLQAAQKADGQT